MLLRNIKISINTYILLYIQFKQSLASLLKYVGDKYAIDIKAYGMESVRLAFHMTSGNDVGVEPISYYNNSKQKNQNKMYH